ncbi:hypothetical protein O5D80_001030 [Batrachochytrium dendrobatidis]|nr:hypothetical protein O5D80_001030 [Batrachochytrium dendrobatidis]
MRRSDKDSINSCDKIWPKQANLAKITKSLACKRKRKQLQAHFLFCLQLQFDSSFCPFGLGRQSLLINTIVSCYPTSVYYSSAQAESITHLPSILAYWIV